MSSKTSGNTIKSSDSLHVPIMLVGNHKPYVYIYICIYVYNCIILYIYIRCGWEFLSSSLHPPSVENVDAIIYP